jgi:hypothetical protein
MHSIIGTWKLVSCEDRWADGSVTYPYGKDPKGYYIFSQEGYSSVLLTRGSDSNTDALAALLGQFVGYSGRYEIQDKKLTVHSEISTSPQLASQNTDMIRFFEFKDDGNTLELSTPSMKFQNSEVVACVVWHRIS